MTQGCCLCSVCSKILEHCPTHNVEQVPWLSPSLKKNVIVIAQNQSQDSSEFYYMETMHSMAVVSISGFKMWIKPLSSCTTSLMLFSPICKVGITRHHCSFQWASLVVLLQTDQNSSCCFQGSRWDPAFTIPGNCLLQYAVPHQRWSSWAVLLCGHSRVVRLETTERKIPSAKRGGGEHRP